MDPVTHALVGSSAARVVGHRLGGAAWLPGAVGALLPDADALVRSTADPLLYAEFHRHVTHAVAFIPAGGAIAALPWLLRRATRPRAVAYLVAATTGYATHGVLDASTTYGTSLWWPFSDTRVAWNVISIVDPVFTTILLVGAVAAVWSRSARPAAAALLVASLFLAAGALQRDRALDAQRRVAQVRGHTAERGAVFPGFGTTLVWRSLYASGGTLYMDRLRVPWWGDASWRPGPTAIALDEPDLDGFVRESPRLLRDFRRFRRFANGWVARAPNEPGVAADARYSSSIDRFEPVWAVRLGTGSADTPVAWIDRSRTRELGASALWSELRGDDPRHRRLPRTEPGSP